MNEQVARILWGLGLLVGLCFLNAGVARAEGALPMFRVEPSLTSSFEQDPSLEKDADLHGLIMTPVLFPIPLPVMAGLDPAIHGALVSGRHTHLSRNGQMDARIKSGA